MYEEKYRPFVVSTLVGGVLWSLTGGFLHAYVICPDWERSGSNILEMLLTFRSVISLVLMGLAYGLAIELAKFIGAVFRSQLAVVLAPMATGAFIGILQSTLVRSDAWGYASGVVFRSEGTCDFSGAAIGFILVVPCIMVGIKIRSSGQPW